MHLVDQAVALTLAKAGLCPTEQLSVVIQTIYLPDVPSPLYRYLGVTCRSREATPVIYFLKFRS